MIIATLTLTMDDKGRVEASGPLNQQAQCYAILQLGMDIVRAYNPAADGNTQHGLDGHGVTLHAAPGEPAVEAVELPENCSEKDMIAVIQEAKAKGADIPPDLTANMYCRARDFLSGGHYPNDVVTVAVREAAEEMPEIAPEPAPVDDSKLGGLKGLASF